MEEMMTSEGHGRVGDREDRDDESVGSLKGLMRCIEEDDELEETHRWLLESSSEDDGQSGRLRRRQVCKQTRNAGTGDDSKDDCSPSTTNCMYLTYIRTVESTSDHHPVQSRDRSIQSCSIGCSR